jgi:hypothetical protein
MYLATPNDNCLIATNNRGNTFSDSIIISGICQLPRAGIAESVCWLYNRLNDWLPAGAQMFPPSQHPDPLRPSEYRRYYSRVTSTESRNWPPACPPSAQLENASVHIHKRPTFSVIVSETQEEPVIPCRHSHSPWHSTLAAVGTRILGWSDNGLKFK